MWDFTCPDTLAPSHLPRSSTAAGSAAVAAENKKQSKYIELSRSSDYAFVPVAIETLGSWGPSALAPGPSALDVTAEIGGRIARCTGDIRSTAFLRQRLDIAIQKGNAVAVHGTMAAG